MFAVANTSRILRTRLHRRVAVALSALCVSVLAGAGTARAQQATGGTYIVQHRFTLRPGGDVPPSVGWDHFEYAHAENSIPQTVTNVTPRIVNPVPTAVVPSAVTSSQAASVTGADAAATATAIITVAGPREVSGTIIASGSAKTSLPAGLEYSYAHAKSGCRVGAQGGRRLANGTIRFQPNIKWSPPVEGQRWSCKQRIRDPIIARRTDLISGVTTEQTLLSIDAESIAGPVSWDDAGLLIQAPDVHLEIKMQSPWTVQQGTLELRVVAGLVTTSVKTGVFAGAPLPPVGASMPFMIDLPAQVDMDYDMGAADDNVAIEINFSNAGATDDVASQPPILSPSGATQIQSTRLTPRSGPMGLR
jgi:hypothetical protein